MSWAASCSWYGCAAASDSSSPTSGVPAEIELGVDQLDLRAETQLAQTRERVAFGPSSTTSARGARARARAPARGARPAPGVTPSRGRHQPLELARSSEPASTSSGSRAPASRARRRRAASAGRARSPERASLQSPAGARPTARRRAGPSRRSRSHAGAEHQQRSLLRGAELHGARTAANLERPEDQELHELASGTRGDGTTSSTDSPPFLNRDLYCRLGRSRRGS